VRREATEIFKVLSVESRVKILDLLNRHGEMGAKKIAEEIGISVAAVSQHLKIMQQANLVKNERKGYHIPYSVDEDSLMYCRVMMNKVCRCGCDENTKNHHPSNQCHCSHQSAKSLDLSLDEMLEYKKDLEHELKTIQIFIDKLKT
jgi:DNA-binding transcriptional ArsR family regulator